MNMKKIIYDLKFIDNDGDVHERQLSSDNEYVLKIFPDDVDARFVWLNKDWKVVETTDSVFRWCFDVSFLKSIEISKREIDVC